MFRAINWAGIISLVRFLNKFLPRFVTRRRKERRKEKRHEFELWFFNFKIEVNVFIFRFRSELIRLILVSTHWKVYLKISFTIDKISKSLLRFFFFFFFVSSNMVNSVNKVSIHLPTSFSSSRTRVASKPIGLYLQWFRIPW